MYIKQYLLVMLISKHFKWNKSVNNMTNTYVYKTVFTDDVNIQTLQVEQVCKQYDEDLCI